MYQCYVSRLRQYGCCQSADQIASQELTVKFGLCCFERASNHSNDHDERFAFIELET